MPGPSGRRNRPARGRRPPSSAARTPTPCRSSAAGRPAPRPCPRRPGRTGRNRSSCAPGVRRTRRRPQDSSGGPCSGPTAPARRPCRRPPRSPCSPTGRPRRRPTRSGRRRRTAPAPHRPPDRRRRPNPGPGRRARSRSRRRPRRALPPEPPQSRSRPPYGVPVACARNGRRSLPHLPEDLHRTAVGRGQIRVEDPVGPVGGESGHGRLHPHPAQRPGSRARGLGPDGQHVRLLTALRFRSRGQSGQLRSVRRARLGQQRAPPAHRGHLGEVVQPTHAASHAAPSGSRRPRRRP